LNQLALPEGRHTVTLRHADAAPHSEAIEVKADRPMVVRHRFDR
jgi:serine/threonine-protein kinase